MNFTGTTMVDFVAANSSKSHDYLRPNEVTTCCKCGHQISNVFIVDIPAAKALLPMGGDCLATITGDNSTRRLFRKVVKDLNTYEFDFLEVDVQREALRAHKITGVVEWSGETTSRSRTVAVGNAIILKAAAAYWCETNEKPYGLRIKE